MPNLQRTVQIHQKPTQITILTPVIKPLIIVGWK